MEFLIPIRDIVIEPGKRLDPSAVSENEVVALIKKIYGFLAETMEVSIRVEEAQQGEAIEDSRRIHVFYPYLSRIFFGIRI